MDRKIKIGLVGVGMVGEPIRRWFIDVNGYVLGKNFFCYDADTKKGYSDDVNKAEVIFIAVPTPSNTDGSCNTSIVEKVVATIKDNKIIVIKSTVPPGTVESLQKKYPKKHFIFNPEFLTESQAWEDFVSPDRQIVGHTDKSKSDTMEVLNLLPKKHFIRPWQTDYAKKSVNATEAELGKYVSNVFGYVKVIYGNIIADVCHALNKKYQKEGSSVRVDYENMRELMGADLRIGGAWLNVEHGDYSGAGGYCFPKDMNAFISFADDLIAELKKKKVDPNFITTFQKGIGVLKSVREYNEALLKLQGLTIHEVSKHNKELILKKRKKIRA